VPVVKGIETVGLSGPDRAPSTKDEHLPSSSETVLERCYSGRGAWRLQHQRRIVRLSAFAHPSFLPVQGGTIPRSPRGSKKA